MRESMGYAPVLSAAAPAPYSSGDLISLTCGPSLPVAAARARHPAVAALARHPAATHGGGRGGRGPCARRPWWGGGGGGGESLEDGRGDHGGEAGGGQLLEDGRGGHGREAGGGQPLEDGKGGHGGEAGGQVSPRDAATSACLDGGPPKKREKTTKASIVPYEDDAPASSMCFLPSQSLEPTTTKKRKHDNSITGASKSQMLEKTTKGKGLNLDLE
ncbi:translation initiation factor IF-2-like [Triticum aestivum]|uniref:translation initiation factor IF-2-like n=1 Tax=Triticum aestivum TaxID=4565 RepID=UPI001D018C2E|nr:translation initiation factor IF-2-like [Triticum aestivum]